MSSQEIVRLIGRYFGPMLKKTQNNTVSSIQQYIAIECKKIIIMESINKSRAVKNVGNVVLDKKQS
jgi:hypothetical protein